MLRDGGKDSKTRSLAAKPNTLSKLEKQVRANIIKAIDGLPDKGDIQVYQSACDKIKLSG